MPATLLFFHVLSACCNTKVRLEIHIQKTNRDSGSKEELNCLWKKVVIFFNECQSFAIICLETYQMSRDISCLETCEMILNFPAISNKKSLTEFENYAVHIFILN